MRRNINSCTTEYSNIVKVEMAILTYPAASVLLGKNSSHPLKTRMRVECECKC